LSLNIEKNETSTKSFSKMVHINPSYIKFYVHFKTVEIRIMIFNNIYLVLKNSNNLFNSLNKIYLNNLSRNLNIISNKHRSFVYTASKKASNFLDHFQTNVSNRDLIHSFVFLFILKLFKRVNLLKN